MQRRNLRSEGDIRRRSTTRRSSNRSLTNPFRDPQETIDPNDRAVASSTFASAAKSSSPSDGNSSQTVWVNSSQSGDPSLERHKLRTRKKRPALKELAVNRGSSSKLPRTSVDTMEPYRRRSLRLVAKGADAVTPSPAVKCSKTQIPRETVVFTRSRSSSISSVPSSSSKTPSFPVVDRPRIPDGVVDLFPSFQELENKPPCFCRLDHCSPNAVTEAYLASYGWEYSKHLKERENSLSLCTDEDSTFSSNPRHSAWFHSDTSSATSVSSTSVDSTDSHEMNYMARQPHLTPKMRSILVDWFVELAEEYMLQPRTLHLAVVLLDQSLARASQSFGSQSTDSSIGSCSIGNYIFEKDLLQCLGCSCMWIACKVEELEPPSVDDFVYISDSSCSRKQIMEMELTVCTALQFHIWHVTPFCYAHEYLRASQACTRHSCLSSISNPVLEAMVMYLLELSLLPYTLVMKKPSLIAAASVYLARATLGISDGLGFWTKTLQHYTGYNVFDLEATVLAIHKYQRKAEESDLKSVYAKYKTEKFMQVSLKTVRHAADLGF